jgi:NAD-reducing hydrogenase small subunit
MDPTVPGGCIPACGLPVLRDRALPLHQFVRVDIFIPGCPPAADTLFAALDALITGVDPIPPLDTRFGA